MNFVRASAVEGPKISINRQSQKVKPQHIYHCVVRKDLPLKAKKLQKPLDHAKSHIKSNNNQQEINLSDKINFRTAGYINNPKTILNGAKIIHKKVVENRYIYSNSLFAEQYCQMVYLCRFLVQL